MNREEIKKEVKTILSNLLAIEESKIKDDSNFVSDLYADSLDGIEIIMGVEDKFNISIRDKEAYMATTLNSLVNLIRSKLSEL